jgi:peroxiredoxin
MADERQRNEREPDSTGDLNVGDTAPDFHLRDGAGREIALSDYRGHKHVVLFFVRAFQ